MLGCLAVPWKNQAELMLMLLACFAGPSESKSADAHDAGRLAVRGKNQARLTANAHDAGLLGHPWEKPSPADAHDAGLLGHPWEKPSPADAHDAGPLGRPGEKNQPS